MSDNVQRKDMFDMPEWLVQQTREQQAEAPDYGLGFTKGKLDSDLHQRMLDNIDKNAPFFRPEHKINEISTTVSSVIPVLLHEDHDFNHTVMQTLQPAHTEWSGMQLNTAACYGFRAYQRGSYLHNHVDRTQTHVVSSTICVDHRLEEPWPLYIEDIDGKPHQVDLEPGEYIFYEGARLIHGRPWPLKGDYYIGLFVHYSPQNLNTGMTVSR